MNGPSHGAGEEEGKKKTGDNDGDALYLRQVSRGKGQVGFVHAVDVHIRDLVEAGDVDVHEEGRKHCLAQLAPEHCLAPHRGGSGEGEDA